MRCTIITNPDDPTELTTVDTWFTKFADQISFISENQGCGCCVNIWKVEATDDALAALPAWLKGVPLDGG